MEVFATPSPFSKLKQDENNCQRGARKVFECSFHGEETEVHGSEPPGPKS